MNRIPFYITLIRTTYLLLVLNALIAPVNYDWYKFLPAFFMMWLSYMLFKKGAMDTLKLVKYEKYSMVQFDPKENSTCNYDRLILIFVIFMVGFIPLYIFYYTGANAITLLLNFRSMAGSDSNYMQYQQYFEDNNLGAFTLAKAPYIITYGITKLIFIFFCFYYISFTTNVKKRNYLFLFILFFLYFLQGVSRGTSFENFELLIILLISSLVRLKVKNNKDFFTQGQLLKVGLVGSLGVAYFIVSKSMRYAEGTEALMLNDITDTFRYNSNSIIMQIAPYLGAISMNLAGYFTFGIYFTAETLWNYIISSNCINFVLPFTANYTYAGLPIRVLLQKDGLDTGACWDPDFTSFLYTFGLPLLLFAFYYLGKLSAACYYKGIYNRDLGYILGLFLITYEMISMFIGNFLVVSSANKICLVLTILLLRSGKFMKFRIVK